MAAPSIAAARSRPLTLASLNAAFPGADVQPAALELLDRLSLDAAVVLSSGLLDARIVVRAIDGFRSIEDPDWVQLVLVPRERPQPGTDEWRDLLDRCGGVLDRALELRPDLSDELLLFTFEV